MSTSIEQIKHIITIASGKGGVGKSTVTANLALALHIQGAKVGILDADIYGPNQPQMLGVVQKPLSEDRKTLEPIVAYDIQSMSIGYLINQDAPIIWRGPMATGALQQLLNNTRWSNLDYLLVDLPPGTGDIQLSLTQKIPKQTAIIVTTPQAVALLDVSKAIAMFQRVKVPILGIVENMSGYHCAQCGHYTAVFGKGGAAKIAKKYSIDLLGSVPLDSQICTQADQGKPFVKAFPDSPVTKIYYQIATRIKIKLKLQASDPVIPFPKITIVKDSEDQT